MYIYIYTHTRIFTDVFLRAWCFSGLISVVMADPPWDIHMELLGKLRFPMGFPWWEWKPTLDLWGFMGMSMGIDGDFIRFYMGISWGFQ